MGGMYPPKAGGGWGDLPPLFRRQHETKKQDEQALEPTKFSPGHSSQEEKYQRTPDEGWLEVVVACTRPVSVYQKQGGGIAFNSKEGWGDLPFKLPCGQCSACRIKKQRDWAIRCMHEAQMGGPSCFLTLTYSDQGLPADAGLDVQDWQRFAKKMRKKTGPFRFFHCGEYGDDNYRPHYHALIFGQDFADDRYDWKSSKKGNKSWRSETLESLWTLGTSEIGQLNYTSAKYVAGYCLKTITGDKAEQHYTRVHPDTGELHRVKPEYVTMSRRPGLGASWYDKFKGDLYPSNECIIEGRRYSVPRYYALKMAEEDPGLAARIKKKAEEFGIKNVGEQSYARMNVKEEIARLNLINRKRRLG